MGWGRGKGSMDSYDICTYVHLNSLRLPAFTFFAALFVAFFSPLPVGSALLSHSLLHGLHKMWPRRVNHKNNIINVTFTWQLYNPPSSSSSFSYSYSALGQHDCSPANVAHVVVDFCSLCVAGVNLFYLLSVCRVAG